MKFTKNGLSLGARWKTRTGVWTGLDWTGFFRGVIFFEGGGGGVVLFFLISKKITFSTFPQQAIFFPLGRGGVGKGGSII